MEEPTILFSFNFVKWNRKVAIWKITTVKIKKLINFNETERKKKTLKNIYIKEVTGLQIKKNWIDSFSINKLGFFLYINVFVQLNIKFYNYFSLVRENSFHIYFDSEFD